MRDRRSARWAAARILAAALCLSGLALAAPGAADEKLPADPLFKDVKPLESAAEAAEQRFGLSEEKRQAVFRESLATETRAGRETAAKFSDPETEDAIRHQSDLVQRFQQEVARKHGLSEEQLTLITAEGYEASWPTD